jgi:hypothetical protein
VLRFAPIGIRQGRSQRIQSTQFYCQRAGPPAESSATLTATGGQVALRSNFRIGSRHGMIYTAQSMTRMPYLVRVPVLLGEG